MAREPPGRFPRSGIVPSLTLSLIASFRVWVEASPSYPNLASAPSSLQTIDLTFARCSGIIFAECVSIITRSGRGWLQVAVHLPPSFSVVTLHFTYGAFVTVVARSRGEFILNTRTLSTARCTGMNGIAGRISALRLSLVLAAAFAVFAMVPAGAGVMDITNFAMSPSSTQAAGHPDVTFSFNRTGSESDDLKQVNLELPADMFQNPENALRKSNVYSSTLSAASRSSLRTLVRFSPSSEHCRWTSRQRVFWI